MVAGTNTAAKQNDSVAGKAICFLCEQPIQNKLYVQEIPGVDVVKNKFVCSVHLDLCTACWGPHQSVFGGKSASDKKEADHYWAAKAFKRGVPNAAPYFYFKNANNAEDENKRQMLRRDERPYFECCHPQCFCMKCHKPKIVSRFIDSGLIHMYCTCQNSKTSDFATSDVYPQWETYGSLGSSTHEEGPFALPYIFFEYLHVSLCDLSRTRTQGIKLSPSDCFLDDTWERYVTDPKLKAEKPTVSKGNISFAVQDCKFFLGLPPTSKGTEQLDDLLQYINTIFRAASPCFKEMLDEFDNLPEEKRNGAEIFNLVKDKRFRIPLMSLLFWHLNRDKPWGDVVTGAKFSELVNDCFVEYKNNLRQESDNQKYGVKELSYLYRTSPQIIIQDDLGLNVFGRGLKFFPSSEQKAKLEEHMNEEDPIFVGSQTLTDELYNDLALTTGNNSPEIVLFRKEARQVATEDQISPSHYKSLFDFARSYERSLFNEAAKEKYENEECDVKKALVLTSCQNLRNDENTPNSGVIASNDMLRAALGVEAEPETFQQKFALKLANAVSTKDAQEKFPSLSEEDLQKLRLGVAAKGATSSLATLASPLFKSKFQKYINALKDAKKTGGSEASLNNLDKAIDELIQQEAGDAAKLFVSKEGKVGMLLLTGKVMSQKREAEELPENVNDWMMKSEQGYDPVGIDGRIYDAIMRALETDKSLPWMIATPTFESYLESVLENPVFDNSSDDIEDIEDLIAKSNALFEDAAKGDGSGEDSFEDKLKQRNEAAMKITPPLKPTEPVIDDLCERIINGQLSNEIPDSSLLNSLSAIDPESVYNNPGLLKIITESEMGVKSADTNISNIEKMKRQLANQDKDTKPAKRNKDIVSDITKNNPDLVNLINFVDEDLIKRACESPNCAQFVQENMGEISELTPLEKVVFADECVLKNKNVDPIRREQLCKEILETLSPEEKAVLIANDSSKFAELFPKSEAIDQTTVEDNVMLSERADESVRQCLSANPDQSDFALAQTIPDLVRKRFNELRELAKKNGVKDYGDVGLTESELNSAVRRALEALYNRAFGEKGPDDPEVSAIGYFLEKAKQKELKMQREVPKCHHCEAYVTSRKCQATVDDELIMRCLEFSPECVVCGAESTTGLCLYRFRKTAKAGDEDEMLPCCSALHQEVYYLEKTREAVKLMLGIEIDEASSGVSFQCEGTQSFEFWRTVQGQLDINRHTTVLGSLASTGREACKIIWRNRETPENAVEELMALSSMNEAVESCASGENMSLVPVLRVLKKCRAREVLDIAVLGLISAAELGGMYDDFQLLLHSFDRVSF